MIRDRVYRTLAAVLLLKGFGLGAALPFISVWLVNDLGASAAQAGAARAASGVAALGFALIAARNADKSGKRRRWILLASAIEIAAWMILPSMTSVLAAIGVASLATLGGATQAFAAVGDWIAAKGSPPNTTSNTLRMSFALGWLAGPALGGFVMGAGGARFLFLLAASAQALALLVTALFLRDAPPRARRAAALDEAHTPLAARARFVAVLALAFGADAATRSTLLPLYVVRDLHVSTETLGAVLAIGVVCELPAFLWIGRLADRAGSERVVRGGLFCIAAAFAVLFATKSIVGVAVAEVLRVPYVAALHGTAMVTIQRLYPGRIGLAMALYGAAFQLAPACTSPVFGAVAESHGFGAAFAACGAMAIAAAALVQKT